MKILNQNLKHFKGKQILQVSREIYLSIVKWWVKNGVSLVQGWSLKLIESPHCLQSENIINKTNSITSVIKIFPNQRLES